MTLFYAVAADLIVILHFSYVAFVVGGQFAILFGIARRQQWARNCLFRTLHLLAIGIVVFQAACGITCPLTTWEKVLRRRAGEATYHGDFIASWVHDILFFDAKPWVFTLAYSLFGLVVLATFLLAPPRMRS